ncbi:MAG: SDR family oxidoreductase [Chitinophagaceae bacterium]|nr:MAG: SDR family oxidoreductase [Chitinophagaceae bacterium]
MKQYAVITGGSKGIGRATVLRFAREGFGIITCARNGAGLEELKKEIGKEYPGTEIFTLAADLSRKEEVSRFARFCLQQSTNIAVLVNNTGVFMPGQIHNEEEGVLELQVATNLYSAYYLTRALLPPMIEKRSGHIFTICSTASIEAYPNGGSYCITKHALYGMTKVLREEMKSFGIRVSAILPGATYTASWEGVDLPEERFMKPEDVAEVIWCSYALSKLSVVEEVLMRPQLGDLG